jgi:hypothetical protein
MSILVSAVVGAVCGGLGGLIGGVVAKSLSEKLRPQVMSFCVIVGAVVSQPISKEFVQPRVDAFRVQQELDALPNIAALKEFYPAEYQRVREKIGLAVRQGSGIDAANVIRGELATVVAKAMTVGSPTNLVDMIELMRDELRAIQKQSLDDCGRFATTGTTSLDLEKIFGAELGGRDLKVTAELLKQAAIAPHPWSGKLSEADLEEVATASLQRVPVADQALVNRWVDSGAPMSDLPAACFFTIAMMDELLSRPPVEAGQAFLTLQAAQSN